MLALLTQLNESSIMITESIIGIKQRCKVLVRNPSTRPILGLGVHFVQPDLLAISKNQSDYYKFVYLATLLLNTIFVPVFHIAYTLSCCFTASGRRYAMQTLLLPESIGKDMQSGKILEEIFKLVVAMLLPCS
jgi:hypothetical protein